MVSVNNFILKPVLRWQATLTTEYSLRDQKVVSVIHKFKKQSNSKYQTNHKSKFYEKGTHQVHQE